MDKKERISDPTIWGHIEHKEITIHHLMQVRSHRLYHVTSKLKKVQDKCQDAELSPM